MARVLVADDDRPLLAALRVGLAARGHQVELAVRGAEALDKVAVRLPDLVVLDLGLPDLDGLEVCRRLREWSDVPVIVLSAETGEQRKVAALDGGADDYVTKPFAMAELEARIRAVLRHRPAELGPEVLWVGDLEIDLRHHQARRAGTDLGLTAREWELLAYLARHAGKVCTHQLLLHEVWGDGYSGETEYVRAYVYRLRRKLGDADGRLLRTLPQVGYSLVPSSSE